MIAYIYFNPKKHPQTLVHGGSRCHGKMKLAPGALTSGDRHCQLLPEQEGDWWFGSIDMQMNFLTTQDGKAVWFQATPSILPAAMPGRGVCLPWARSGQHQQVYGPLEVLWWAPTHLVFSWGLRSFRMRFSWLVTLPKSWIPWCWQIQAHSFYRLLGVPGCRSSAYSPVFRATFSLLDPRPFQSTLN